jgi:hypothetical protein
VLACAPLAAWLLQRPVKCTLSREESLLIHPKRHPIRIEYKAACDDDGKLLDDGTVTRIGEQSFRLTAAEPQFRWLSMNAVGMQVQITELTEQMAALSLQGPKSRTILNLACEQPVDSLKYFRMAFNRIAGQAVSVSRTGYTGDLGYEIWMDAADALGVWDALMAAGHDYGITPTGILAMDMARVEAGLFMLDVDYTPASHAWIPGQRSSPYEMGLGWTVNLDKQGYFVGRRALEREHREGSSWKMVGLEIDWEGLEREYAAVGMPPQVPATAVRGSIPGRYVTAGVRLAPRASVRTEASRRLGPFLAAGSGSAASALERAEVSLERLDGLAVLVVRAPGAQRVDVMGDFTDWQPFALSATGDGRYRYALGLPSGMHRFNLRVDGGSWGAPRGASVTTDEFGGVAAVVVVP